MTRWKQIERRKRQILELKNEVKSLNEKVDTMDKSLDCHEQYSRRNCLLIHGVKENKKEDTDEVVTEIFEKEMEEKVSVNYIDRSHRFGKKHTGSRPQPVIIKFARYNVCNTTLEKRRF